MTHPLRTPDGRIRCCVPFCEHTSGRTDCLEWICGDHWRLIDQVHRRAYGRYRRRWRRYGPGQGERAAWRLWCWLKRKAIERAMGITG